jgi:glycosyltransferase involved in cell wall biosynthesis
MPFPPKDGGCIAMNNITQGLLNEGHSVKVLAVNTPKHFTDLKTLPEDYLKKTQIEAVFIDTSVKAIPAFLNLFSKGSYNISRFYSVVFENKLIEILKANTFDIIHLESLFVSMYLPVIRKYSKGRIVMRAHNIEHLLWERNAAASNNLFKRKYFSFLAKRLKEYELKMIDQYDAVAAISEHDASWYINNGFKKSVRVFPFGFNLDRTIRTISTRSDNQSVFHIGAMDWQPNIDGLKWFLDYVWPKVIAQAPTVQLYLAGRKMEDLADELSRKNVVIVGEVEDSHQFMVSKGLMIIPLLSGGGMRVKLIEGMALGKVIVSTSIGAEGVDCRNGEHLLIADSAEVFSNAILSYLSDPDHKKELGENARKFVMNHYNNADISRQLTEFYQSL